VGGPQARAADLGCGTGRFDELLADRFGSVLAVDISARELEIARTRHGRPEIDYRLRSLLDVTPESDGRFDLVLSVNTIFHLRDHDRVLPHVRDLVAPGGRAVLVDIVRPGRAHGGREHSALRHRWFGVGDAARTLRRRGSLADAWLVLRLRQHKAWMQHAATNRPLTRAQFHRAYGAAFPGAAFTDSLDPFVCALVWRDPAATPPPILA
jgi:SAM-dependent methyltransferase